MSPLYGVSLRRPTSPPRKPKLNRFLSYFLKDNIMGSGSYFSDVRQAQQATQSTRSSEQAFAYNRSALRGEVQSVHPDLNIYDKVRECCDSEDHPETTPIVVAMDVTASRGDDAKAIYAEVPKLLGVIQSDNIVSDPQILWAAVGDANCDKAPIQVSQFESDRRIDQQLGQIWMEEGGGGTGEESYELLAYYLANRSMLDSLKRGKRGFLFFTGDEAPYEKVSAAQIRSVLGIERKRDLSTKKVFAKLQESYDPYLIFPRSSMEERKKSIDEEIRKRLLEAGGRFKEVSIRASLIWHDRNDLDLHCMTPDGYHIYYGDKRASCGGELDVDRNVHGETTKPVENIRWAKGTARPGKYTFWVENYRYHESDHANVSFKVELDIDGEIKTFEGETKGGRIGERSKVPVFEFVYTPGQNSQSEKDQHSAYRQDVVLGKWRRYIPDTQILKVQDPASSVEVMLGVLALKSGKMDLAQFERSMKARRVPKARRVDVRAALEEFALRGVMTEVDENLFA